MYDRLNTGGRVFKPQEIRANLYQSDFYRMLYQINENQNWRDILESSDLDKYMRDIEGILRAFALLMDFDNYKSPMTNFLNSFSHKMKKSCEGSKDIAFSESQINRAKELFLSFLENAAKLRQKSFLNSKNQFSNTLFEAIFLAACGDLYKNHALEYIPISQEYVDKMKEKANNENEEFYKLSVGRSASENNIKDRIKIAKETLTSYR